MDEQQIIASHVARIQALHLFHVAGGDERIEYSVKTPNLLGVAGAGIVLLAERVGDEGGHCVRVFRYCSASARRLILPRSLVGIAGATQMSRGICQGLSSRWQKRWMAAASM